MPSQYESGYRGEGYRPTGGLQSAGGKSDYKFMDSLESEVRNRKNPQAEATGPREDSMIARLRNSQEHYDEIREKKKQEYKK